MDPNQVPAPVTQPTDAPAPVTPAPTPTDPSQVPESAPVIVSTPVPAAPYEPQVVPATYAPAPVPQEAPKKSKKGLVLGIIGGALLLILLPLVALFFFAILPATQTAAFATGFIQNITGGNVDAALLKTGNDQSYKSYLVTSAEALKGNKFALKESSYKSNAASNFLFTLSGGDKKYARVTVEKKNGERQVTAFVYSASELKLVATTSGTQTVTQTSTSTSAVATTCLGASSFTDLTSLPVEASYDGRYVWYDYFFFMPDTTGYKYADQVSDKLVQYKSFYQKNSDKQFTVTLTGMVASATAAKDLANARAEKAKTDLMAAGIPSERIVIAEPKNVVNTADEAASRNVDITIQSPESCITKKN